VHDDGVGIDSRPVTTNERGWGIAGMRERVEAVGGQMFIDSTPGQGTTVMAIVPLVNEEVREEHGHGNNSIIAG
jgi:signal transduction histidine kinase